MLCCLLLANNLQLQVHFWEENKVCSLLKEQRTRSGPWFAEDDRHCVLHSKQMSFQGGVGTWCCGGRRGPRSAEQEQRRRTRALLCRSRLYCINHRSIAHSLAFILLQNCWASLCLPVRSKLTDARVQRGVPGFGLSAVRTPAGLYGNVPFKCRDWHSVLRAPNKTDPRISHPHFCLQIRIPGEGRAWAVYRSASYSVRCSELA